MIKHWEQLLEHFGFEEKQLSKNQVLTLLQWCKDNVSSEKEFIVHFPALFKELKTYLTEFFRKVGSLDLKDTTIVFPHLNNMTPIQYASYHGYDQYLQYSLSQLDSNSQKAAVNQATKAGLTALHLSALNGNLIATQVLLANGADGTKTTEIKQTPIQLALTILSGAPEKIKESKKLIYAQLKKQFPKTLGMKDISGNTVVHFAAQNGFLDLLKELTQETPNAILQKNNYQRSIFHIAVLNKQFDTAKFLAQNSQLFELGDEDGRKPVHYAAMYCDNELLASCLTKRTLNILDRYQKTPLHFAAEVGNLGAVKFLIAQGADVTKKDFKGYSVLHYALASLNVELAKWLIENTPVDINQNDKLGRTPLLTLVANYRFKNQATETLIEYLIDHGSDLTIKDNQGNTLADYINNLEAYEINLGETILNSLSNPRSLGPTL